MVHLSKRLRIQVGALIILSAIVYMMLQGAHNFRSYFLTVQTFQSHLGKYRHQVVRVQGTLLAQSVRYSEGSATLRFTLESGHAKLPVVYHGMMPNERYGNASAIVKGQLAKDNVFRATKLEIQCPDHYTPARGGTS